MGYLEPFESMRFGTGLRLGRRLLDLLAEAGISPLAFVEAVERGGAHRGGLFRSMRIDVAGALGLFVDDEDLVDVIVSRMVRELEQRAGMSLEELCSAIDG